MKSIERGQMLLLVIVVMVISLTVGLSVATRSIMNLRTSTDEGNSQRALSAAEAGIEQSLKSNQAVSSPIALGNNATATTTYNDVTADSSDNYQFVVNNGNDVLQDDGVDVWMVPHDSAGNPLYSSGGFTGNLTVLWGKSGSQCSQAAVDIVVISNYANPVVNHYPFDPCSSRGNQFGSPSGGNTISVGVEQYPFSYGKTIAITDGLIARIIPIYTSTKIGIMSSGNLPAQGQIITATGIAGDTERKIVTFRGYPKVPTEFFPFVLFSPKS